MAKKLIIKVQVIEVDEHGVHTVKSESSTDEVSQAKLARAYAQRCKNSGISPRGFSEADMLRSYAIGGYLSHY